MKRPVVASVLWLLSCAALPAWAEPSKDAGDVSAPSQVPAEYKSELYAAGGFILFSGSSHLFAGVGGGLGFRHDLGAIWSVYSEVKANYYTGASGTIAAGMTGRFSYRKYRPEFGFGAMLFFGEDVRILDSKDASLAPPIAVAITTRISPLRFVSGRYSASALSVDVGCGLDSRSRCALALSVNLLETGVRF